MSNHRKSNREARNTFRELLKDPQKKLSEAENIPAKMFRRMLLQNGILVSEWDRAVEKYYRRAYGDDIQGANTEKSNLLKALNNNALTWKRFETALEIMGFAEYEFTVTARSHNGYSRKYTEKLRNRQCNIIDRPGESDESE